MRRQLAMRRRPSKFRATFARYGTARAAPKLGRMNSARTLLFTEITDDCDRWICDHIWFQSSQVLDALALVPGDQIEFQARAQPYKKGYLGFSRYTTAHKPLSRDWRLSNPRHVRRLELDA